MKAKYSQGNLAFYYMEKCMNVIEHYDKLIDENNDPVRDPAPLKAYMDRWDGQGFIDAMELDRTKAVLEIGVGTGRLAAKVAPLCADFLGVDFSPKTVERAKVNLREYGNVRLECADFLTVDLARCGMPQLSILVAQPDTTVRLSK
jgi:ubiquinone/menaquinone biosynthesis C-methylase UbiE